MSRIPGIHVERFAPVYMADGPYYHDSRPPFTTADWPQITLSTTSLMLWPSGGSPSSFGAGYWTPGKRMKIDVFGKMTTVATPGNLTIEIRYGTTDNGGTILATSLAYALSANKTNISYHLQAWIASRLDVPGTSKGLFAWGKFEPDASSTLILGANNPAMIPANTPAAVNVDLTAASAINIQMKRSGSTAEVTTVQDLIVTSLN